MLKLKRFDVGKWYDFPGYDGVRLKIKPLSQKVNLEAISDSSRLMSNEGTVEERPSFFIYQWEVFRRVLEDWKGIEIPDEGKFPRLKVMEGLFEEKGLKEFVIERAGELAKEQEEALGQELKNSETSPGG